MEPETPASSPNAGDPIVVITAVGRDRPGTVAALARAVFDLGGNLDDAIMTRLHGAFTTMVAARLPEGRDEHDARRALAPVAQTLGLTVTVQTLSGDADEAPADLLLTVYGADQPGIVYRVTERLAARHVNITDMDTRLTGTAQSPVYVMQLEVASGGVDLADDLAALRQELGVSISAQPMDSEAL